MGMQAEMDMAGWVDQTRGLTGLVAPPNSKANLKDSREGVGGGEQAQGVMRTAFNVAMEEAKADGDPSPGKAENIYLSHYPTFVRHAVNPNQRPVSGSLKGYMDDSAVAFLTEEGMTINASSTVLNFGYVARGTPFKFLKKLNSELYTMYWGEAQEL